MKRHHILRWCVFITAAFLMNFPLLATVITALKGKAEVMRNPSFWIQAPTLENFITVFTPSARLNIFQFLWNSTVASLIGAILPMLVAFPMAWAMARRGYGQRILLPMTVNIRALPLIIFAIPLYMMYSMTGLLDSKLGLGLILAVVNLPLTLLLLVNAIGDIPLELEEAARVDGTRLGRMILRVVLPLCRPALITTFVFGFITSWNEFLFGLMLTTRQAVPMTVGASSFFASSGGGVQWGVAAAVMVVAAIPPLLIGVIMYRKISGSMISGAVKG